MRPSRSPFPHSQDSATIPRKQGADMSRTRVGVFAHIQTAAVWMHPNRNRVAAQGR